MVPSGDYKMNQRAGKVLKTVKLSSVHYYFIPAAPHYQNTRPTKTLQKTLRITLKCNQKKENEFVGSVIVLLGAP